MKTEITDPITGKQNYLFCASYQHKGAHWGLDFYAEDDADAAEKLAAIKATLTMDGVVQYFALAQSGEAPQIRP